MAPLLWKALRRGAKNKDNTSAVVPNDPVDENPPPATRSGADADEEIPTAVPITATTHSSALSASTKELKFDEIWNDTSNNLNIVNGPTPPSPLEQQLHVPSAHNLANKQEATADPSSSNNDLALREGSDEHDGTNQDPTTTSPAPSVLVGTTRIGKDPGVVAAASGAAEFGSDDANAHNHNNTADNNVEASTATAANKAPRTASSSFPLLLPPSMFHLKRWASPTTNPPPPPREEAGSGGNHLPRLPWRVVPMKHARSSDLEATQASGSDGDIDSRSALGDGDEYTVGANPDGGAAAAVVDAASLPSPSHNPSNVKTLQDDNDDDYVENNDAGVEMSLRQYRRARTLSRHQLAAHMAHWRDSLQDLKRRRRRCFWSTVALLALILLIIIVVAGRCGGGRCSKASSTAASASTGSDTTNPKFGRLTQSPTAAPSAGAPTAAASDDDAIVTQHDPFQALLGGTNPSIILLNPTMSASEIQSAVDSIFYRQQNNEMGTERYTVYFMPGTYGSNEQPLYLQIGYYTELAGLGATPADVTVYGKIEVYNRCFQPDSYKQGMFVPSDGSGLCFALNSFWRSLSNLSIQIVSLNQDSCRATAMFWAVSQAVSMRRVDIRGGDVSLMDYCTNPAYASGGFIADSRAGNVISGSQQQFVARNMDIAQWQGSVWNQVFLGTAGAPADTSFPDPAFTVFPTTPVKREKPFLYTDASGTIAYVHVPSLESSTVGTTWAAGSPTPGTPLPLSEFFVADPSHSATAMNKALAAGKNLILSPGVYDIDTPIIVDRENAVVLGTGHATLTAINGVTPLQVRNHPGIIIAGVTLDAGETLSEALLEVGSADEDPTGDISNPITLSDVYFRLGGPHIGKAKTCLTINANDVLIDHTWVWRADHGVEDFDPSDGFMGDNQRWTVNVGEIGVVVNGDDVIANGLFVEHYQQYNVLWKGERGRVYFFQNELPYDPPTQADWTASDGTLGWAAYKVDDAVTDHQLWAGGVYCYNRNNPDIVTANAFEVPQSGGIQLQRVFTRNLSGPGTIQAIVNGIGDAATNQTMGPHYTDYGSS